MMRRNRKFPGGLCINWPAGSTKPDAEGNLAAEAFQAVQRAVLSDVSPWAPHKTTAAVSLSQKH